MPRKPEPVPIEPDVEDAITRGARQAEASRAALASGGQPKPSAEATDAQFGTERVVVEDEMHVERIETYSAIDDADEPDIDDPRGAKLDRAAVEQVLRDIDLVTADTRPPLAEVLTLEQLARAAALEKVGDDFPDANVGEVLALADYIVTGTVPLGLAIGGGR
jgi:hypothetical protein